MASTLVKSSISQAIGDSLIQDIFLGKSKFYYTLGRVYPWNTANDAPETAIDTEKYDIASRNDILYIKKVEGTSLSFVIPRENYTANTVYEIYDDSIELEDVKFYAMNSDFNVYKCLYNNKGAVSTSEPFGTSSDQVTSADGYVWQFVYTIPPALRAKFLTPESMPIYNAITTKYYSRGSLTSVIIDTSGSDYSPLDTSILVSGDGYLADNPYKLSNSLLVEGGSGYTTTPIAETADIFKVNFPFTPTTRYIDGQVIKVSDVDGTRFYKAMNTGVTSAVAPTHTKSTILNGSLSLKHVGSKPFVDVDIDATVIGSVYVANGGFGYSTAPVITKTGSGAGATFTVNMTNSSISEVVVTDGGSGYTTTEFTVAPPVISVPFTPTTAVDLGDILSASNGYFYQVDVAGTTNGSEPTHTEGSDLNGTALLTVIAQQAEIEAVLGIVTDVTLTSNIDRIQVTNEGSGYVQETTFVTFTGGSPISPAVANAIVSDGKVVRIDVTFPGYGYRSTPSVNIVGDGVDATASPIMEFGYGYQQKEFITFSDPDDANGALALGDTTVDKTEAILEPYIVGGKLRGVNVIDGGIGYTSAKLTVVGSGTGAKLTPLFASGDLSTIQAQTELFAIPGTVSSIKITNEGSNINAISINVTGDGSGVELEPVLEFGRLTEIKVITPGRDYTYLDLEILVNPDATVQPEARAILSPRRGHGSDPLKEFYTNSVALFASFSDDINNGFEFDNQFRQICIVKNPQRYNSTFLQESKFGSTCFAVSANTTLVPLEKNIILNNDSNTFRVISFTPSAVLLEYIGNSTVSVGDVLSFSINNTVYSITVTEVTLPQVDKYSGDLLYIDNLGPFTPSTNQTVSVTTTIKLK